MRSRAYGCGQVRYCGVHGSVHDCRPTWYGGGRLPLRLALGWRGEHGRRPWRQAAPSHRPTHGWPRVVLNPCSPASPAVILRLRPTCLRPRSLRPVPYAATSNFTRNLLLAVPTGFRILHSGQPPLVPLPRFPQLRHLGPMEDPRAVAEAALGFFRQQQQQQQPAEQPAAAAAAAAAWAEVPGPGPASAASSRL